MSRRPIGIFDSGIGGLTVFKEIAKILPNEDLVYLGDTARVPYGTKSAATVTRYAVQNVRFLLRENVKLVIVACNTASAFALEALRREFDLPLLGVIEPGVTGALRSVASKNPKRIVVIGTEGTIASEAYGRALRQRDDSVDAKGVACPLFVPLVEEGWWDTEVTEKVARTYLDETLKTGLEAMILGCTHYPLLKGTLSRIAGPRVALVDSAEETARETAVLLEKEGLKNSSYAAPSHKFYVTDSPERFQRVGSMILERTLSNAHHVEI
ncbi:MAG TPA: glutamate racemase [bacterium]|nr:glutamate racemase [bacterium]